MFDGKEEALAHRDSVKDIFIDELAGDVEAWHISPVIDGAMVKVAGTTPDVVIDTFESRDYPVKVIGEGPRGDWHELKVKQKP